MEICYIFGYGSLISSSSRAKTGITGQGIPVKVNGVKRSWQATSSEFPMATVGIKEEESSVCNGVLFPIKQTELKSFDDREKGYVRKPLRLEKIDFYSSNRLIKEDLWVYFIKQPKTPNPNSPIVQSYVDVIVKGSQEFGDLFTEDFFNTTDGWDYTWLDDRKAPRYPRHLDYSKTLTDIDQIIEQYIPHFFKLRIAS